jgi:cyclic peptide transporter
MEGALKMKKVKILSIFLIVMAIIFMSVPAFADMAEKRVLTQAEVGKINDTMQKNMKDGKIPGVALVVVQEGEIIYQNDFGYADVENKKSITADTVFELASNSKAFTGLAILKLEKEGMINLKDPVEKYIPWLQMRYNGEKASVTVEQVMNHTSGIPFKSIDNIVASDSDQALEEAMRTLIGMELQSRPGEAFSYATINYDILGLIIETVIHQSYETYIRENILDPIGLNNTYLFREDVPPGEMAKGYRINFLKAREYDAPMFRGNKPAGYIMSTGNDIGKWLITQLGFNTESRFDQELITRSHAYDKPIVNNDLTYTAGWFVDQSTGEVFHGGNNPNFSSHLYLNPETGIAIAALANLNSPFTEKIVIDIANIIQDKPIVGQASDFYMNLDRIAVVVIIIAILVALLMIFLISRLITQVRKKIRVYVPVLAKGIVGICISLVFMGVLGVLIYRIPALAMNGVTWYTVKIWAPPTIIFAVLAVALVAVLIYIFLLADSRYKKKDSKPYFLMILLSFVSGVGNALIIFMINESLKLEMGFHLNLLLFFLLGLFAYAGCQRIVRTRLIKITNQIIYELRVDLINKILKTSYENLEKLEDGRIQATLNNDTETVANFANILIGVTVNIITMICCFIYLGFISPYALLLSVLTILVIASIFYLVSRSANKLLEETRTIQNVFFKFINEMGRGFKELRLNIKRRRAFEEDVDQLSEVYTKKRGQAFLAFADVFVVGELVFTLAIGTIVFIFPVIFRGLQNVDLRSYVFVLLYITGPVNGVLNAMPNLMQIRVSWNRIKKFSHDISELSEQTAYVEKAEADLAPINLQLRDVEYEYTLENTERFKVGPISYEFNSGEIVFVTGGNGSGKSTLAKLITGLYRSQSGEIILNGNNIATEDLEQKYAAIFGDFHIFDKLYGIDYDNKKNEFQKYLDIMQLSSKIELEDGSFNTTKLSTGQRKRLALAVSYLEDRPIYLFDEWAADQDVEFREFFYRELLPELKEKGKCVIAITHDDRYFSIADKVIKMEMGQITTNVEKLAVNE